MGSIFFHYSKRKYRFMDKKIEKFVVMSGFLYTSCAIIDLSKQTAQKRNVIASRKIFCRPVDMFRIWSYTIYITNRTREDGETMVEVKRGDVVYADLSGVQGSEQGKSRVCVVIQNDIGNMHSPTTIVVPLTSQLKKTSQPTHALIQRNSRNRLKKDSMVLCEQVRVIDKSKILDVYGNIDEQIKDVYKAYVASFGTV